MGFIVSSLIFRRIKGGGVQGWYYGTYFYFFRDDFHPMFFFEGAERYFSFLSFITSFLSPGLSYTILVVVLVFNDGGYSYDAVEGYGTHLLCVYDRTINISHRRMDCSHETLL